MITALFILAYIVLGLVTARLAFVYLFKGDLEEGDGVGLVMCMLLWPIAAVLGAAYGVGVAAVWLVTARPTPQQRRAAREKRMAAELKELRELARRYDLPMAELAGDPLPEGGHHG